MRCDDEQKRPLTAALLRESLSYDPLTGVFTWLVATNGRVSIGGAAGSLKSNGYLSIGLDKQEYRAHRLAWLYMTGEWPEHEIDHKNTIRHDNKWENLRQSTRAQNQQNRRKPHKGNRSGLLGVQKNKKRWQAKIKLAGKVYCLGTFDTPELAHAAYLEAKSHIHPFNTIDRL